MYTSDKSTDWRELAQAIYESNYGWQEREEGDEVPQSEEYFDCD